MYLERMARLTQAMQSRATDALVVVPGANMRYLTGQAFHTSERLNLIILPADGSTPCMVLPAMEVPRARATAEATLAGRMLFFSWTDEAGPKEALRQALVHAFSTIDRETPMIGVEYLAMRLLELRAIEAVGPTVQTEDATLLLADLRMVKAAAELALLREAVRIVETALQQTIARIQPGVTEQQLAAFWKDAMLQAGAEGESFPCQVASGPNSANPHHHTSQRAVQPGDLIILDGGALYQGYASDMTRTVALGEPGEEARRIYDLVLQANTAARAALHPGTSGEAIDQAARQVIVAGGYGEQFVHRTGHGLGMDVHELPNIVAGSQHPLAEGTTFTIEPGIYLHGLGGVRIEDDVVITASGGESLTSMQRDLLVLPV